MIILSFLRVRINSKKSKENATIVTAVLAGMKVNAERLLHDI